MIYYFQRTPVGGKGYNDLNEKRLGASHGSKAVILSDDATGSPVTEIGYNQFFIAVLEEVDMVTYQ